MDGRIETSNLTRTEPGIIHTYRNIGGEFDLGAHYFGLIIAEEIAYARQERRNILSFCTYHYSVGDPHRGCKGCNYDTEMGIARAMRLKGQYLKIAASMEGEEDVELYPIVMGIETDNRAFVVHGSNGEMLDFSGLTAEADLRTLLGTLFGDMSSDMLTDLTALLKGNLVHVADERRRNRSTADLDHRERVLAVGSGFSWLKKPNLALILAPYSWEPTEPIVKAAGILLENLSSGRIPADDGLVMMSSVLCRNITGPDFVLAKERAYYQANIVMGILNERVPAIIPHIYPLVGIVDADTQLFERFHYEMRI
jgi:hypothetical protein